MEKTFYIRHLDETNRFASHIATHAFPGMVIGLHGDLGSGKTTFAQFLAAHLHVTGIVNSPTFTILKIYQGDYAFYHMDVYRLVDSGYDFELDEYIYGSGISVIEWYPIISAYLPESILEITITRVDDSTREVVIKGSGEYEIIVQTLDS